MNEKSPERWNLNEFLTSIGMSDNEAEAWIEARKKGRPLKREDSDAIGERLDNILQRNSKVIYAVDKILNNDILINSYLNHSMRRLI